MPQAKMQHCFYCGEELGVYVGGNYREPEACGKAECQRELRDAYRQMDDEARESAREDNYERYR